MSDTVDAEVEGAAGGLRERKKRATGRAIALAAVKLAAERGVENVRVEEIAAEAQVSPRTFNNYFPSKEAAIVSLAMDRFGRIAELLRNRPARESLPAAIRAAYAAHYAGAIADDRDRLIKMRLVIGSGALKGEYLKAAIAAEGPLGDAIMARIGDGDEKKRFARVLAAALIGSERTAVRNWMEGEAAIPLATLIREGVETIVGGARSWPR